MKLDDFKGKKITVMGLGLHGGGTAIIRFLSEAGAKIVATDLKSREELSPSVEKLKGLKNIEYVFGQHRPEDFSRTDMVVKNPAVPWGNKYVKMALEKNIPVEIDSSLFFKICKNPVIGITGTKGKTTTSTLIYEILKTAGKNPVKVGIGQTSVLDKLKELKKENIAVFELSSWRLSALGRDKISPRVAVLTNIYQDHLNYYKTMEEYVRDKKYIFLNQKPEDFCVANWDDKTIRGMESEIKARKIKFSCRQALPGPSLYVKDMAIFYDDGDSEKKVMELSEIKLKGGHNLENILAAAGAAFALGVDPKYARKAIMEFKGIEHRLEFLREINGVRYYNDTAATTPDSAMAGIASFSEPLVLIAGGSDKNLDMAPFAAFLNAAENIKKLLFLKGAGTDKIIEAMKKSDSDELKDFSVCGSMEEAVEKAKEAAAAGDTVLLSPGAASFGLFQNEFDRGNKFREAVKKLK